MARSSDTTAATAGDLRLREIAPSTPNRGGTFLCTVTCREQGRRRKLGWEVVPYFRDTLCSCLADRDGEVADLIAAVDLYLAARNQGRYAKDASPEFVDLFYGSAFCALARARHHAGDPSSDLSSALLEAIDQLAEAIETFDTAQLRSAPPDNDGWYLITRSGRRGAWHNEVFYAAGLYAYPSPRHDQGNHHGPIDAALLEAVAALCGDEEPEEHHIMAAVATRS